VARLIRAAGLRWPVEEDFEFSKGCFGLDQSQVRLYTAIARHTVLGMALAICAVTVALLRHRTDTQAPAPVHPDQPPPEDPGMTPLTVPEITRLLTTQPAGPRRALGELATKLVPAGTTTAPGSPATPRLPWSASGNPAASWVTCVRWWHQRERISIVAPQPAQPPAGPGAQIRVSSSVSRRLTCGIAKRFSHAGSPALRHLAQDVCFGGTPAGHRRYLRCPAQLGAATVERAVARDGVPACRDHDRVAAVGADGNVTVNAGAGHGHGPRPRPRQPRGRPANAIQVASQGASGGIVPRARRGEPGQAHSSHGQAEQADSHIPSTKRARRGFQAAAAGPCLSSPRVPFPLCRSWLSDGRRLTFLLTIVSLCGLLGDAASPRPARGRRTRQPGAALPREVSSLAGSGIDAPRRRA
jgi:hypothetical protein